MSGTTGSLLNPVTLSPQLRQAAIVLIVRQVQLGELPDCLLRVLQFRTVIVAVHDIFSEHRSVKRVTHDQINRCINLLQPDHKTA